MDVLNWLDFGFDGGINIDGFNYVGDGMDCGLFDFVIQFFGILMVEGNVSFGCIIIDVFVWLLSYGGFLFRFRFLLSICIDFEELNW